MPKYLIWYFRTEKCIHATMSWIPFFWLSVAACLVSFFLRFLCVKSITCHLSRRCLWYISGQHRRSSLSPHSSRHSSLTKRSMKMCHNFHQQLYRRHIHMTSLSFVWRFYYELSRTFWLEWNNSSSSNFISRRTQYDTFHTHNISTIS